MSILTKQIAKQLRDVYFGGNWTWVHYKEHLDSVSWQEATTKVDSFNTIAALVYHTGYYITAVTRVFESKPFDAHDKYAFDHPPVNSEETWNELVKNTYANAEHFAKLIEGMPESLLWETFMEEKYGNYYRNLTGIIEHLHYHLGQVVLIKKLIASGKQS